MSETPSFREMLNLNGDAFSAADYVHFVISETKLRPDFILCLLKVCYPKLSRIDEVILVESVGGCARYRKFRAEGMPASAAQYWSNLLELRSLLDITYDQAVEVGHIVVSCWSAALNGQYPSTCDEVRVITDSAEEEVFVVLSSYWP